MTELEKKLTEFFDNADENELGLLDVYPEEKLKNRVCESICSSALRKAGIDMQENKTVKRTGKRSKRIVGLAIAAAVLATGAISAGAYAYYTQFINRQNVQRYLGEKTTSRLEDIGLAVNEVKENEHARVTLDTVISDGQSAQIIFTVEKLDDEARSVITACPEAVFCYPDTGEEFVPHGSSIDIYYGGFHQDPFDMKNYTGEDIITLMDRIPCGSVDFSRPVILSFIQQSVGEDYGIYDGIEFELDLSKNVETAVLTAENGRELTLSPFGVSTTQLPYTRNNSYTIDNIILLKADGEHEAVNSEDYDMLIWYDAVGDGTLSAAVNDETAEGSFNIFFPEFCDVDDYEGIRIEGVKYTKQQ